MMRWFSSCKSKGSKAVCWYSTVSSKMEIMMRWFVWGKYLDSVWGLTGVLIEAVLWRWLKKERRVGTIHSCICDILRWYLLFWVDLIAFINGILRWYNIFLK